jgi:hypothetical protein
MQACHALQAAAKQFGFDGTERSLEALESAFADYRFVESVKESPEGLEGFPILSPREATAFINDGVTTSLTDAEWVAQETFPDGQAVRVPTFADLAGETLFTIPATLGDESHAEVEA